MPGPWPPHWKDKLISPFRKLGGATCPRWRWVAALAAALFGLLFVRRHLPVVVLQPGEVAVRVNQLTGRLSLRHDWALALPGLHHVRCYSLRDQIYRPAASATANGESAFQSVEGLTLGADLTMRYALDGDHLFTMAETLPEDVGGEVIQPMVDGVLHRVFAQHTVREIFSTERAQIQDEIEGQLRPLLAQDGVVLKGVFIGNIDLPSDYRSGLSAMLNEELASEKMRYTLELRQKEVKETELQGEAEKMRRGKAAEAAALEVVTDAKAKEEAMKHILPFKQKEIQQRGYEAEAAKVARLKEAEATADARRIEAGGEADGRRKLADSDAYRVEVTGKAQSAQLARDAALISQNPLLILALAVQPLESWRELWVFHKTAGRWACDVLVPATGEPELGYLEAAGWSPDGSRLLAARETIVDGAYARSFEVLGLASLQVEKSAASERGLTAFRRWASPDWRRSTVAVR